MSSKLKKRLKKLGRKAARVASYAAPIVGGLVGGPLGAAAGTALGMGAAAVHQEHGSRKKRLKRAALAGAASIGGSLIGNLALSAAGGGGLNPLGSPIEKLGMLVKGAGSAAAKAEPYVAGSDIFNEAAATNGITTPKAATGILGALGAGGITLPGVGGGTTGGTVSDEGGGSPSIGGLTLPDMARDYLPGEEVPASGEEEDSKVPLLILGAVILLGLGRRKK